MYAVVHVDEGILYGLFGYTEDKYEEARQKMLELSKRCTDPAASFAALVKFEVNTGQQEEILEILPEYD